MSFMKDIYAVVLYSGGFLAGMICMELLLEYTSAMYQDKFDSKGTLPSLVTLSQFIACFLLPWLSPSGSQVQLNFYQSRSNLTNYGIVTLLVFGATALATASLHYVAYPVKIVFKSSKLIPTMIVSIFFLGKSFSLADYLSALMLCTGTALFVYDPTKASPAHSHDSDQSILSPGVLLLLAAVTCDAFLPNVQKRMLSSVTPEELMVNSNLFGSLLLFFYMLCSGAVNDFFRVLLVADSALMLCASLAGVGACLASAVLCYTHLIKEAGPIVAVGVATLRKVVTLVLSYVVFPKPLSLVEISAFCLIVVGLGIEAWKRSVVPITK